MEPYLENFYCEKTRFIKDFIKYCRYIKNNSKDRNTFIHKIISVNGELWHFNIFCAQGNISTQPTLFLQQTPPIKYPKTMWGSFGKRWDFELREFLNREINKY